MSALALSQKLQNQHSQYNQLVSLLMFLCVYECVQGSYSLFVYSVNGCLQSSVVLEEEVTALHLVLEYVILGTVEGNLQIRDLFR